jgi:hypothetical protein
MLNIEAENYKHNHLIFDGVDMIEEFRREFSDKEIGGTFFNTGPERTLTSASTISSSLIDWFKNLWNTAKTIIIIIISTLILIIILIILICIIKNCLCCCQRKRSGFVQINAVRAQAPEMSGSTSFLDDTTRGLIKSLRDETKWQTTRT